MEALIPAVFIIILVFIIVSITSISSSYTNEDKIEYSTPLPSEEEAIEKIKDILYRFSVAGVYYREYDEIERARKLQKGEKLILTPEPDNEYDKHAIKVITEDNYHIGYIPSHLCRLFNNIFEGKITTIYVYEVEEGNSAPYIYVYVDNKFIESFFE